MPPIYTKPSTPLLITSMLERGVRYFPKRGIVSRGNHKEWRYTYADMYHRVCRLANVLKGFGIERGDRVATFAWNNRR